LLRRELVWIQPSRTIQTILVIDPGAEEVISYRVPAFRVDGKTVAGFAAFKKPQLPAFQRLGHRAALQ